MNRREFLQLSSTFAALSALPDSGRGAVPRTRTMKIALTPGSIGVTVQSQKELNQLASQYRFEAVEPRADELAAMSGEQRAEVVRDLKAKQLVWAAPGLPVDFR